VNANRLTWLGHSTVLIELDGTRVLTDPVLRRRVMHLVRTTKVPDDALDAIDLVVVSHAHWDHLDLPSLRRVGRRVTVVVPKGVRRLLASRGFRNVVEVVDGSDLEVAGVRLRATYAEHDAGRGPLGFKSPALGYVLEGSRSIYFAGDTDLFDGMSGLASDLDLALVPIAGWGPRLPAGHLDPERAAEAVRRLRPRRAIPVHWGTYRPIYRRGGPEGAEAAARFAARVRELAPDVDVQVLQLGESCEV
jgi:L-ascorbate metabolism protein UlaG (beta-lactamase superfamily)